MKPEEALRSIYYQYTDKQGLIIHRRPSGIDGGDCANRCGIAAYLSVHLDQAQYRKRFRKQLNVLEVEPGIYIRHTSRAPNWDEPDARDFARWNDPKVFSRDQSLPLVLGLGEYRMKDTLKRFFKAHLSRFFRAQNGDFYGPDHVAVWIRAFEAWWLYPLLILCDVWSLLATCVHLVKAYFKPGDTSDDIITTLILHQATHRLPTFISKYNARLYARKRSGGVLRAWSTYFKQPEDPPFNMAVKPIVEEMK